MTTGKYYNLTQNWPGMTVWLTPWQSPWLTKVVIVFGQFCTLMMFWRGADKPFSVKWLCFLINLSLTPQQSNFCVFLFSFVCCRLLLKHCRYNGSPYASPFIYMTETCVFVSCTYKILLNRLSNTSTIDI